MLRSVQLNVCHTHFGENVVDVYYWMDTIGNIFKIFNCRLKGLCKHIIVHILLYPLKIHFVFFPIMVVDL